MRPTRRPGSRLVAARLPACEITHRANRAPYHFDRKRNSDSTYREAAVVVLPALWL